MSYFSLFPLLVKSILQIFSHPHSVHNLPNFDVFAAKVSLIDDRLFLSTHNASSIRVYVQ